MGPVTHIEESQPVLAWTNVLDHGYVKLIETWGSEERIIEAARMSTSKGFLGWGGPCVPCAETGKVLDEDCDDCNGKGKTVGDEKLLAYLYNNKHMTPFEMAGMVFEVQAPIFVFREWHRHRTQSYNEMSARYIPIPDLHYVPDFENLLERAVAAQEAGNKQARAANAKGDPVGVEDLQRWVNDLKQVYRLADYHYREGLELGVPKELARLPMPVGRYSRMRCSANLRNWLGFLTLRNSPFAQWEIQQYAKAISGMVYTEFPRTSALHNEEHHE